MGITYYPDGTIHSEYTLQDANARKIKYETYDSVNFNKYVYSEKKERYYECKVDDEYILALKTFENLIKTKDILQFEKEILPLYNKSKPLRYEDLQYTGFYIAFGDLHNVVVCFYYIVGGSPWH